MALGELKTLTEELETLARLLKDETRVQARWIILQRAQEIMKMIGQGCR